MNSFAQGPKWTTLGNTNSTGDCIGSLNFQPFVIKTNNVVRGTFTATGDFQLNNLIGTGTRLIATDANGNIIPFPMGPSTKVLFGDGSWGAIPSSYWSASGSNIYYNSGHVGIGTATPSFPLDVIGDVRISNNLYVGGGIIITDRVNANAEVVTGKMRADSIVTDSTKGFYGTSKFNGDVKLSNKLSVDGSATIGGNFKTMGSLTFAGNKTIDFLAATPTTPDLYGFGASPAPPVWEKYAECNSSVVVTSAVQYNSLIQSYGNHVSGGQLNVLTMGFDGANGVIDLAGTSNNPLVTPRLLINYNCGKDVFVATGPVGGNIVLTSANSGTVAIGDVPVPFGYKLAVKGKVIAEEVNVRLFGDWPDYVFEENYKFLSIPELKDFTEKEKHLPNMPTAENVEKNGINLSETVAKLLRTQEEQTKYIIQLYEQNLLLKKEIELLKK